MKPMKILVLAGLVLAAPSARGDGLFYLAGTVGTTSVDADLDKALGQVLDGDDEGAAFGLGLRFGDHLAFELTYHDFGSVTGSSAACSDPGAACIAVVVPVEGDTTAFSLSFLPHLPLSDNLILYGKLGVMSWETGLTDILPGLDSVLDEYSDEDIVYGAGVRYLLPGPFGAFVEFERFADSFETLSLGATLGF